MGCEFIFSVISTLSSLLSSVRSSGATLVDGEGDDMDRLDRLLKRIQAALYDAGNREIRDASVMLWLKELKTVAYEAEDILDECQYELLRRQIEDSRDQASSSSSAIGKKRKHFDGVISDEMAERIKSVIKRFDEISKDKDALSWREDDGERRGFVGITDHTSPTGHMVNESAIFGRCKDKQTILDFVSLDNTGLINRISVVAIVGMGGLGKTTLAQLVYNDSNVQDHFDLKAWVYVSPVFDVIQITKGILESINPGKAYSALTGLSAAQQALVKVIREKKFLIVLDDVWNDLPGKWEQFLEPLRSTKFVRIVVTTRDKAVAQKTGASAIHNLGCLSKNQSGKLFEHHVFSGKFIDESSCLKEIGKEIVKKCAGVPLAIKSIGRVLSYEMDEENWRHILESELWECDDNNEIFPALKVSYYSLPSELKPCFLFCSLFPKGSVLKANEIIYMWIAHGYVQPCASRMAEDIGNGLVHELYKRSFLTKVDTLERRGVEYFVMHDLIHDLARSISMGEFYTINHENNKEAYNNNNIDDGSTGVYHAYTEKYGTIGEPSCGRLSMRTLLTKFVMDKHVCDLLWERSLFRDKFKDEQGLKFRLNTLKIASPDNHLGLMEYYNSKILGYRNLRVLKWEGVRAQDLVHIDNLKHLRYLELNNEVLKHVKGYCGKLERLPESISHLCNLVALQLRFLPFLKELPVQLTKLINLRFLSIHLLGIKDLPESLGQISNLQYLSVSSCFHLKKLPTSIGKLASLKQLYISDLFVRELPESFCMLQNLQTLSIVRCWYIRHIPDGIGDLTSLQWIYYSGICIETPPQSMNSLLHRSSLNFSIERSGGTEQDGSQIMNFCRYVKTQRLIESFQPVSDLVKLEINEYHGIGYASWCSDSCTPSVAVAMHCHFKSGNFFRKLGELPSLKSLSLIRITSVENLQFNAPQNYMPHTSKVVLFPCLQELEFVDVSEWDGTTGKHGGDFPLLESLKIENCPKLRSVPNFGNIRRLDIIKCSFSILELDLLQLQLLESLCIEECLLLTLLKGLEILNSIRSLYVLRCPLLKEFLYPVMPKHPLSIEIVACPFLEDWCQIQQFEDTNKELSCRTLVTSASWNIMKEWDHNILVEHLVIKNCIKQRLKLDGRLQNLTSVGVLNCWKLETLEGLSMFEWLRKLVLRDCPQLELKKAGDGSEIHLPPNLQSLAVHGCHNILSLDLQQQDSSYFVELEVADCKRLMHIAGLRQLNKLETLAMVQCPRVLLEPLQDVPGCVIISGCPRLKAWCEMHAVEPLVLNRSSEINHADNVESNMPEGYHA